MELDSTQAITVPNPHALVGLAGAEEFAEELAKAKGMLIVPLTGSGTSPNL